MLYLVATPIGNLEDFTFRAVKILKECDYILCEDTRRTGILCKHYEIDTPLKSYHQFNEAKRSATVLGDLRAGIQVALVSDAGMPGISDPGQILVAHCREHDLNVTVLPGACAAITALAGSGLDASPFKFWGFLPRKTTALTKTLAKLLVESGTHVIYESPSRATETIKLIAEMSPNRQLCLARELTKLYEEFLTGTAQELADLLEEKPPRGELVLIIQDDPDVLPRKWQLMTGPEQVSWLETQFQLPKSNALKLAAELRGCPKKQLYQQLISDSDEQP